MIKRKPVHYKGLDHSGPCKVLPPTFMGVRNLVNQVGESMAQKMYAHDDDLEEDASHDLVRDFLQDLTYADKVERQTLIQEFSSFVSDLQNQKPQNPSPSAESGASAEPGKPAILEPAPSATSEPPVPPQS